MADVVSKLDLYELLNIPVAASDKEIRKAYRKKALKCHPDKVSNNLHAAELFHQLSNAVEILLDPAAREAYDKVLKARKATELRNRELDSKRRKLKTDLENRERLAQDKAQAYKVDAAEKLKREIERLMKEGSVQLEKERELLRKQLEEENEREKEKMAKSVKLRLKWKVNKHDQENGGYTYDNLINFFSKYGDVNCLVVSKKKSGSALIEFSDEYSARHAYYNELGLLDNPLKISWIDGVPPPLISERKIDNTTEPFSPHSSVPDTKPFCSNDDYEDVVLAKLAAAAKRKHQTKETSSS